MDAMDYWRWCDHISVFQAIMLILGDDPSDKAAWQIENRTLPVGYAPIKTALVNAIKNQTLDAQVEPIMEQDNYGNDIGPIPNSVNIDKTTVSVSAVKRFLASRGFNTGFFFPQGGEEREYLNPNSEFYAPKLAAAVRAWEVVTADPKLMNGKTPKAALEKWLRENAAAYGLTKEDGTQNEQGIGEIAKVANWKPEGGASKTPSRVNDNPPTPSKMQDNSQKKGKVAAVQSAATAFDEDPPF